MALADAPNRQQLTNLQRAFDDTTRRLSVYTLIVATPIPLNMTLALGF